MLQNDVPETALAARFAALVGELLPTYRVTAMVDHLYLISGNWNNAARQDDEVLRSIARQH